MNKIFLSFGIFLVLCLVACGHKTAETKAADSQADSDSVYAENVEMEEISPEATVDYYYSVVVRRYMEDHDTSQMNFTDFYSAELKDLLTKAAKKERIYHEVGPVDWDIWINAQDFDNLSVKNVDRYQTDDGSVVVEVTLRNTGTENKLYLTLVNENGLWMVDNFEYPGDNKNISLKPLLEKYVEE